MISICGDLPYKMNSIIHLCIMYTMHYVEFWSNMFDNPAEASP